MRSRTRYVLASSVLVCGALLYLARPTDPLALEWLRRAGAAGLAEGLHRARALVWRTVHLPSWLRGVTSDGAYAFSLGVFLAETHATTMTLGAMLVVGFEVGQGLGIVPGTFDPLDLLVGVVFFALGALLTRRSRTGRLETRVEHACVREEPAQVIG